MYLISYLYLTINMINLNTNLNNIKYMTYKHIFLFTKTINSVINESKIQKSIEN